MCIFCAETMKKVYVAAFEYIFVFQQMCGCP